MFWRRRPVVMARRPRRPLLFIIFLLIIVALAFYLGKSCTRAAKAAIASGTTPAVLSL